MIEKGPFADIPIVALLACFILTCLGIAAFVAVLGLGHFIATP